MRFPVSCLLERGAEVFLRDHMKFRGNLLLIASLALGVGACKKNDEVKLPDTIPGVANLAPADVPSPAAETVVAKLGAEERAAKLGFVKHLPQDTEVVVAYYNGKKTAARLGSSKIWKLVQEQMGGAVGPGLFDDAGPEMDDEDFEMLDAEQADDDESEDPAFDEPVGPAALFGTEFTLALGKSAGDQTGNLLTFYRRAGYFQMRGMAKAFAAAVKSGDASSLSDALSNPYGSDLFNELLRDPESGMDLLDKAAIPPIYLAFRTDPSQRAAAALQVAAMVENAVMLGDMVEPVSLENAGHKFEGYKLLGSKISASMAEGREAMEANLDAATVDRLLGIVAKKDLVLVSGTVGDYVVMFIGGSVEGLQLATVLEQSIVANETLAFSDAFASKELAALVYGQKEAMDTMIATAGGLADMTSGLRDGIAGADGLGDTRDLEAMFQIVAERESALRKLVSNEATGTVAFFEDGLKIESFGGTDSGMFNWTTPNQLSHLGDSPDVLMFVNGASTAEYHEKSRAYLEALMETGYALAMKISEAPLEGEEMASYKEMVSMFDVKFRPEMVALWDSLGEGFGSSLGRESALVIDLKGSPPSVPGVPQPVLDDAKIPRISWVSPVTDRAKLAESWDKMSLTLTGTFAKISEMVGQDIPMQKPISSERDGKTSWFIAMPFLTDDFLPSVTVSDQWFAASTSKNQALDLISQAEAGGEARKGFSFHLNFRALESYAQQTYELADEHAEELMGAPLDADQKRSLENAIGVLADFDKLTIHTRQGDSGLRSSVHFKTR
jgi:hypothetical protein